jgi:hypothetical protein
MGRRHSDVDHHELRRLGADQGEQLYGIAGLSDHVDAGPLEQAGQPLAEEDVVVGEDHP